ncbi:MAG TPA: hypothetical protein VGK54_19420 [Chloroflexota bacterium]
MGAREINSPLDPHLTRLLERARAARLALAEMFYGMMGFEFEREAAHIRSDLENLFIFMLMGDYLGVPIIPPYYNLRLLPYLVGTIPYWQRRILRERHRFEGEEYDLHGL